MWNPHLMYNVGSTYCYIIFKWAIRVTFLFSQLLRVSKCLILFPLAWFEPWSSGVGNGRSTSCARTNLSHRCLCIDLSLHIFKVKSSAKVFNFKIGSYIKTLKIRIIILRVQSSPKSTLILPRPWLENVSATCLIR